MLSNSEATKLLDKTWVFANWICQELDRDLRHDRLIIDSEKELVKFRNPDNLKKTECFIIGGMFMISKTYNNFAVNKGEEIAARSLKALCDYYDELAAEMLSAEMIANARKKNEIKIKGRQYE